MRTIAEIEYELGGVKCQISFGLATRILSTDEPDVSGEEMRQLVSRSRELEEELREALR